MTIRIVADSAADTQELLETDFASVPLKIITSHKEYVDDASLDVKRMVEDLLQYSGKSSTACPGVGEWLEAFGDAERVYCVTITSALSGTYNSACLAKKEYEGRHPERQVFVIDSLSAGPEERLIIEKLQELISLGHSHQEVCAAITEYQKHTCLFFMLESLKNLANNGRVSALAAKAAGLLGIRMVGKASDQGMLALLDKCRGEKRALAAILSRIHAIRQTIQKVRIGHCLNEQAALQLKEMILREFASAKVEIYELRGLCSFYAEKGGLLVGLEALPA